MLCRNCVCGRRTRKTAPNLGPSVIAVPASYPRLLSILSPIRPVPPHSTTHSYPSYLANIARAWPHFTSQTAARHAQLCLTTHACT